MMMIESEAYFESYYHVLKKIKEMGTWDKLPFIDILMAQKLNDIKEPKYKLDFASQELKPLDFADYEKYLHA